MGKAVVVAARGDRRRRWQEVLRRFERSGLSVAEFCEAESISAWSLYDWRRRLGAGGRVRAAPASGGGFVDVGTVVSPMAELHRVAATDLEPLSGIELRIDLGGGLVLQIARR
jgi:transposase-like protein